MAHTLRLSHSTFYSVRSNWEKEPPRPWGTLLQVQLQLHVHHFYAKTIFVVKYFKLIPIKDVSLVLGRVSGKLLDPLDAWEDWAWGRFRSLGLFSTFLNAQSCFFVFFTWFPLSDFSVIFVFHWLRAGCCCFVCRAPISENPHWNGNRKKKKSSKFDNPTSGWFHAAVSSNFGNLILAIAGTLYLTSAAKQITTVSFDLLRQQNHWLEEWMPQFECRSVEGCAWRPEYLFITDLFLF